MSKSTKAQTGDAAAAQGENDYFLHFPDEDAVVGILEILEPYAEVQRRLILDVVTSNPHFGRHCFLKMEGKMRRIPQGSCGAQLGDPGHMRRPA